GGAATDLPNVGPGGARGAGLPAEHTPTRPLTGSTHNNSAARRFNWIGAPSSDSNVCLASPASPFKTIDDVLKREMVTGTSGTSTYDFPVGLNNVIGTRFKLVKGYGGSAALRLCMGRGEIEGFCGVGYNSMRTAGLTEGKANVLVQIGLARNPLMPDVPFVFDYAKSNEARQIFRLVFGWLDLERPIGAPPGVPEDRVK